MSVDGVLRADGLAVGGTGTNVSALSLVLIGHDVIILHRVQDLRPVQGGQVAEIWVLFDSHGTSGDVHEAVEAHLLQLEHLIEHQGVVEEEVVSTDHRQVGEEVAEGLQAVDPEQQHVVGHHLQLRVGEAVKVVRLRLKHEQNLQIAFDDGAVLQRLEVGHIIADVLALTDWKSTKQSRRYKADHATGQAQTNSFLNFYGCV